MKSKLVACVSMVAVVAGAAAFSQSQPQQKASIPPDAEHAQQALKGSPRHGEWVDIPLSATGADSASVKLHTWVVYPERKDKAPVVLVIHEIFGMTDWVRAVADQIAADGYIAVAPDLLSGKGPNGGNTDSFPSDSVREAIQKLSKEEVAQRLNAARDYATALPAAAAKTASIGFCWGGSTSFNYAVAQPKLNAAIVYYGTPPINAQNQPDHDALAKIQCPVLGLYGGDDARVTATVEPTAKVMSELKKPFTYKIFEGAGHGFLRQQSGGNGANLKASQQAWAETMAFLKKTLQ